MLPIKFKNFYTLTAADLGYDNPDDPVLGAVYCPGLICMKTNSILYLGVVVQEADGKVLLGTLEDGLPDYSRWETEISDQRIFRNRAEYLLDGNLPEDQKPYFRALNLYQRIIPENALVRELSGIYLDGGTLTRAQRTLIDKNLYAGSSICELICIYEGLRRLDILAALGQHPGLDQAGIKAMATCLKSDILHDDDDQYIDKKLAQFSHLIKPLSAQLAESWPPKQRVLTLR